MRFLYLCLLVLLLVLCVLVLGKLSARSQDIKVYTNLTYMDAGGTPLSLDLYLPRQTTETVPVILAIHGGSWVAGSRNESPHLCRGTGGAWVCGSRPRLSPGTGAHLSGATRRYAPGGALGARCTPVNIILIWRAIISSAFPPGATWRPCWACCPARMCRVPPPSFPAPAPWISPRRTQPASAAGRTGFFGRRTRGETRAVSRRLAHHPCLSAEPALPPRAWQQRLPGPLLTIRAHGQGIAAG